MKVFKRIVAVLVLTSVLFFLVFSGLEKLEMMRLKALYHDPIFDKVLSKDITLDDLKAMRAKRESLVENPTEEDIAIMKADIDEFRKRYEANNVCRDWVSSMFMSRYGYKSKYREAIKPLVEELALQEDMFALSVYDLRQGNTWLAKKDAAHKGELNNMANEGWFLATGFNRPRDEALGERYLIETANRGSYKGQYYLILYYYRNNYRDKLCAASKEGYERYGLEIFAFEIKKDLPMMEYIQNNCHVFSGKEYTSDEMRFEYLLDIKTDESKLVQAMIMSNTGRYAEARALFEALENNEDQKIRANAQLCLSRMYHFGGGVGKDESLAEIYANRAFDNGSTGATIYREWSNNNHVLIRLPEQLLWTDYNCVYGGCYYQE
jgi:hypothetical protein